MADGMWTMNDDGSFELQEPYRSMLLEARVEATRGWHRGLVGYLATRCPYTPEELTSALLTRNERGDDPQDTMNEFILEALSGDL